MDRTADHTLSCNPARKHRRRDRTDDSAWLDNRGRKYNPRRRGAPRTPGCTPHCPDRGLGRTRWSNPDCSNSRRGKCRRIVPRPDIAAGCNGYPCKRCNRTRSRSPDRRVPGCTSRCTNFHRKGGRKARCPGKGLGCTGLHSQFRRGPGCNLRYKGSRRTLGCTEHCRGIGPSRTRSRIPDYNSSRRGKCRRIVPRPGTAAGCNDSPGR